MMKSLRAPAVLIAIIGACGKSNSAGTSDSEPGAAQASIALSSDAFAGDSVRICGSRTPPADPKYPCASSLGSPDAGVDAGQAACPCFNFLAEGGLVDSSTQRPFVIEDLCPSSDLGAGASADAGAGAMWTFTYSLFDSPGCTGTQLNDGTHQFVCFDSQDLGEEAHPNQSVELLNPGLNSNFIFCSATCTLPPVILLPTVANPSTCGALNDPISAPFLGFATATSPCGPSIEVTVSGEIISRNGTPLIPTIEIAPNGQVVGSLPGIGTYVIRWTATDSAGNTSTAEQTFFVMPRIEAAGDYLVPNDATIDNVGDAGVGTGVVLNRGPGVTFNPQPTTLGIGAKTGSIISVPNVFIGIRSIVTGFVQSGGTVGADSPVMITQMLPTPPCGGTTTPLPACVNDPTVISLLPPLPTLPTCPPPNSGSVILGANEMGTVNPLPASYDMVSVANSNSRLTFSSMGDYCMNTFFIGPNGPVVTAPPGTRIFVQQNADVGIETAFTNPSNPSIVQPVLLGYAGTGTVRVDATFRGTIVAPIGATFWGLGNLVNFEASVYARTIELRQAVHLACDPTAPVVGLDLLPPP